MGEEQVPAPGHQDPPPGGFFYVLQLIRKNRLLEQSRLAAERRSYVGLLASGLAHEIRNPLNAAALQLAVLERRVRRLGPGVQGPLLEPLTLVRDEIRRLDHILEDFLQFARPREFVPRPVELVPVITKVLDLIDGEAERRGIRVERDLSDVPEVAGARSASARCWFNLALNALEASPHGGRVRGSCRTEEPGPERGADGEVVAVTIDDSGPGVTPEARDRIFEPFFTTKAEGSGLGLPIVHAIVTQHGGTIAADEAPAMGYAFQACFYGVFC